MQYDALKQVIDSGLLNRYERWFVAGGYVVDPTLASDIDIWIQVDNDLGAAQDEHAKLQQWLEDAGFQFEPQDMWAAPELIAAGEPDNYGSTEFTAIYKVAVISSWRSIKFSKPVHLRLTTGSVRDVLNSFDISTHAQAMLPDGRMLYGTNWTAKTEDPRILKDTPATPERFVKIKSRYAGYRAGKQSIFTGV